MGAVKKPVHLNAAASVLACGPSIGSPVIGIPDAWWLNKNALKRISQDNCELIVQRSTNWAFSSGQLVSGLPICSLPVSGPQARTLAAALGALTRHHQSLQELKTNIGNQLHADEHSIYSNKKVMKQLKKLIDTIEKERLVIVGEIDKQLYSDPEIAKRVRFITDIKGLGNISVATILAETNGFSLFTSIAQLVSYSGYDVVENQSGGHTGKTRMSKKGNSHIRRVLHMPAYNMVRYNVGRFKPFFERILARHNQKMKAYVAVQKKLLVLIYTIWKKNEPFKTDILKAQNTSGEKELVLSFA